MTEAHVHKVVNDLPRVAGGNLGGQQSKLRPIDRNSSVLLTASLPSHLGWTYSVVLRMNCSIEQARSLYVRWIERLLPATESFTVRRRKNTQSFSFLLLMAMSINWINWFLKLMRRRSVADVTSEFHWTHTQDSWKCPKSDKMNPSALRTGWLWAYEQLMTKKTVSEHWIDLQCRWCVVTDAKLFYKCAKSGFHLSRIICPPEHVVNIHSAERGNSTNWNPDDVSEECDLHSDVCTTPTTRLDMHCNKQEWCTFGPEYLSDGECFRNRTGNVFRIGYNCTRGEWKYLLLLLKDFVRCITMLLVSLILVIHSNHETRPISYRFRNKQLLQTACYDWKVSS